MSDPKEPEFFSTDITFKYREATNYQDYISYFFKGATADYKIIAEASVWYLYSASAVPRILEYNPNAKLIAMIRNPVDMAYSLHSQSLAALDEDIADFGVAWDMQEERKRGNRVPSHCQNPRFLLYRDVCALGTQLRSFMDMVPAQQRHVVFLDDMARSPREVYLGVLGFLGLEDDGRVTFEKINENKQVKNYFLARLLNRPPQPMARAARAIKKGFGIKRFSLHEKLNRLNIQTQLRCPLDPKLRQRIAGEFEEEIRLLENLTGRYLETWRCQ